MHKTFQYLEGIPRNQKKMLLIVFLSLVIVPGLSNLLHTFDTFKKILDIQFYFIVITLSINAVWLSLLYFMLKKDSLKLMYLSLTGPEIRRGFRLGFALFIAVNMILALKILYIEETLVLTEKFSSLNRIFKALRLFILNIFPGAFLEEVLCRAYAIPQVYLLLRSKIKHKVTALILALLVTQMLFSMAHLPRDLFRFELDITTIFVKQAELFMSGIILSLVYLRTRNVIFLAIFHAFMNYGLPVTGTDADFKLFYMVGAFSLAVFWEKIVRPESYEKQPTPVLFPGKAA